MDVAVGRGMAQSVAGGKEPSVAGGQISVIGNIDIGAVPNGGGESFPPSTVAKVPVTLGNVKVLSMVVASAAESRIS